MISRVHWQAEGPCGELCLACDRRAASALQFALLAPVLLLKLTGIVQFGTIHFLQNNMQNVAREVSGAIGALAIDMSRAYSVQNELQTAVDAAALAAARDLRDRQLALRTAQRIIETHFPADTHGTVFDPADLVIGTRDPEARRFTADTTRPNALQLTVRRATANGNPQPTSFARLIGFATVDLEASATASVSSSLPLCLLALNPTAKNALEVAGSSELVADGYAVYANSNDSDAIHARPSASIRASAICAHGGVKGVGRLSPVPETGCSRLADPLAAVPTPSRWPPMHCDDTAGTFPGSMVQLNPGSIVAASTSATAPRSACGPGSIS